MNWQTVLLIVHGLLAVALLGAITHQAASVLLPASRPAGSFVGRFRAVPGPSYVNAVVVLYLVTAVLGGVLYTEYRVSVRTVIISKPNPGFRTIWPTPAVELADSSHFATPNAWMNDSMTVP